MTFRYDPEAARLFFGDQPVAVLDLQVIDGLVKRVEAVVRAPVYVEAIQASGWFEVPLEELVGKPRRGPSSP